MLKKNIKNSRKSETHWKQFGETDMPDFKPIGDRDVLLKTDIFDRRPMTMT